MHKIGVYMCIFCVDITILYFVYKICIDKPDKKEKHQDGIIKDMMFVVQFPECYRSPNTYLCSNLEEGCK